MFKDIGYYIKDFMERCIYFYQNDEVYKKSTLKIFFFFITINIIFLCINFFDKEWVKGFGINDTSYIIISIFFGILWLIVQILYSFITIPSDYIKHDMDKLPDKIGKYPVVIQYNPPKGLNPSEMGMLYNQSYESTNIDCLLYKREYEGLIEIEDKGNGCVILYRNKEIGNDVPSYEGQYWTMIFGFDRKNRVVWELQQSKLDIREISDLHSDLLKYCVEKGRLHKEGVKISGLFSFLFCILLIFISPVTGIVVSLFFYIIVVYHSNKVGFGVANLGIRILTTDEGDKLLAHVIGYKYWLEHCEEKQIKKILKEDPSFNSKTLPYVIALRMDWKLLDKKFNR